MKKIISALLLAATLFVAAGCGSRSDWTFSGVYWNNDPLNHNVNSLLKEKLTYSVSSVYTAEFSSAELKNDNIFFEADEKASSYEAELSVDENGDYVYKTTLKISGKYVYGDKEYEVIGDETYTETHFKDIDEGFKPVKAYRRAENVVPSEVPTGDESFAKVGYEITVEYGDTAKITLTPQEGSENYFREANRSAEIKKYDKNLFLEEDIAVLAFRAVKFGDSANYTFDTIDALGMAVKTVAAANAVSNNEQKQSTVPVKLSVFKDENGNVPTGGKTFDAFGIKFSTVGGYGKTFKYVYYAVNRADEYGNEINESKHVPVKIYQPQIYNAGYLCFTLREVSAQGR